jgi:hypothetical protein
MLGTNDLKTVYNRSPSDIAEALHQYPEYVHQFCESRSLPQPTFILVSPSYMNNLAPRFIDTMPTPGIYNETSVQKSHELAKYIQQVASETHSLFLDSALITQTGDDGCHLDQQSQTNLAAALFDLVT